MKSKYITFTNNCGTESIAIFTEGAGYNEVGHGLDVVGAGFCQINFNNPSESVCYGKSTTLDIESRGDEDTLLLRLLVRQMIGEY